MKKLNFYDGRNATGMDRNASYSEKFSKKGI